MKTRLTERSAGKFLSEFDPPPLLETVVGLDVVGLKRRINVLLKCMPLTKSGGGFNSQTSATETMADYDLRRLSTP